MNIQNFNPLNLSKLFYGYRIVAALFAFCMINAGCTFYTFGLFINALQADFGWGRGDIMVASTIGAVIMGALGPFIGRLVNQYGASRVMAIGAAIGGLGFIVLSQIHELWHFYVGHTLLGTGLAAAGFVAATTVISNWFRKRRGTALGIMTTGVGAGGILLAPLFGGYLIPNYGWHTAYLVFAFLVWMIIPLALFVVKTKPSEMGLNPDGVPDSELTTEVENLLPTSTELSAKATLSTSAFWLMVVSMAIGSFSLNGVIQNQAPYLEDVGFSLSTASMVVGSTGLGSLIGKLLFGWLCDRILAKFAWCIALGLQIVAINMLMNISGEATTSQLWVYAILMGLGFGGLLPTMSMLVSTNFGLSSYSIIYGMLTLAQSTGQAAGPLYAGYMFDTTGSYNLPFNIFLILYIVSIPAILAVRRPAAFVDNRA
jgi:MFS family permease